jgi:hypothetical protein
MAAGEALDAVLGEFTAQVDWRAGLAEWMQAAEREAYDGNRDRLLRHATGKAMDALRGRVFAGLVTEAVRAAVEAKA